jgi:hypothetical protein
MKTYTKLDNNTLKISEEVTLPVKESTFIYKDIVDIKNALVNKKNEFNLKIDAEILEADNMLSQASVLGVAEVFEEITG